MRQVMTELREDAIAAAFEPRDHSSGPILVRGLSRSGGTMMVKILVH
jgi:hypothetical protein